jgi:hypothetical protein
MALYAMLGERDARFDGHIARRHLEARLGFRPVPLSELPQEMARAFRAVASGSRYIVTHNLRDFRRSPELGVDAITPGSFLQILESLS